MNGLAMYARVEETAEELVERYSYLVERKAHHLLVRLPATVQIEDLIQAGLLGLLEAAQRFDSSKGASFASFAEWRIRGAMLDEIRKGDWVPRSVHRKARAVAAAIREVEVSEGRAAQAHEVADHLGVSLAEYHRILSDLRGQKLLSIDDMSPDEQNQANGFVSTGIGPADAVQREHLLQRLAQAIDELPEREKILLSLYYYEALNLKEIGVVLGVSESRVCQLLNQALVRLRARVD